MDFERGILPFEDDSVDEVSSSHCLEHITNLRGILREIVRVCRTGAPVEIRVPHWLSSMAMCAGHRQTISAHQVRHWCDEFPRDWFGGLDKRLTLVSTELVPGPTFAEARGLFPQMSDDQIMRFVPDACHEYRFKFQVVRWT